LPCSALRVRDRKVLQVLQVLYRIAVAAICGCHTLAHRYCSLR
jgi:hypothetical protein